MEVKYKFKPLKKKLKLDNAKDELKFELLRRLR